MKTIFENKLSYNKLEIKEGDKISFNMYGKQWTKKVKNVYVQGSNGVTFYQVNPIGCGSLQLGICANDVIKIKK